MYVAFHRQARVFAPDPTGSAITTGTSPHVHPYGMIVPYWWELLPLGIIGLTAIALGELDLSDWDPPHTGHPGAHDRPLSRLAQSISPAADS
jgi:hypothetical protein